jgi:hypothetical protein
MHHDSTCAATPTTFSGSMKMVPTRETVAGEATARSSTSKTIDMCGVIAMISPDTRHLQRQSRHGACIGATQRRHSAAEARLRRAQLAVVVEHRVHRLDPQRVDRPVEVHPLLLLQLELGKLLDGRAVQAAEDAVGPLVGVLVELAVQLAHRDRLGWVGM